MSRKPHVGLRGLRTFCLAARHESFRAAGEELFITASAVSHQIKSLEQELGELCFDGEPKALCDQHRADSAQNDDGCAGDCWAWHQQALAVWRRSSTASMSRLVPSSR